MTGGASSPRAFGPGCSRPRCPMRCATRSSTRTGRWRPRTPRTRSPSRSARRRPPRTCRRRASPGSRTPISTWPAPTPSSTPSAGAGRRCGTTGRSSTAPRTTSTSARCASPSSCSGWSTPASPVLFTANPLTRRRRQTVIDAAPGLGDRIVSGAVNPDHFVVDTASGAIVERRAAGETPCLTDAELRRLAATGARVEALFGSPQDVEFAVDHAGGTWVTQARPITTLYPLPTPLPTAPPTLAPATLRVYLSFNVAQGVFRPLTPMGIQALRLFATSTVRLVGPPADPAAVPRIAVEAGHRL